MKRLVVASASIFALMLGIGLSRADYFVIKIDLNNIDAVSHPPQPPKQTNPNPKGGGMMGVPPGGMMGVPPGGGMMGVPPGGMMGVPPGGFMGGQPGGFLGGKDDGKKKQYDGPHHWVHVYLEEKTKYVPKGAYIEFNHQFGNKATIPYHVISRHLSKEPLTKDFEKRMKKDGKDPGRLIEIAQWALTHGLMDKFDVAMGELKKLKSPDPSHQNILKNYAQAQQIVKEPLKDEDTNLTALIKELKDDNYRSVLSDQRHYQLLSNLPRDNNDAALKRRLVRLEQSYEAFFYWFALQDGGPRPQAPLKRLVAVLVKDKVTFEEKHAAWGSKPMSADGFTPRRDNLVILSPRRLDDTFTLFEKNTQGMIKGASRDDLVSGKVWENSQAKQFSGNVALMQTLALIHRALEDESERATVTHEGTRQLLAATGLLPRTVEVPEWIQSGLASYFETPVGAVYPGFGTPSWSHLIVFKDLKRQKKLGEPGEVLFNLLTDRYFRHTMKLSGPVAEASDKDKEKAPDKQRAELEKGRALAWSLLFYLAQEKKMHYVARYCEELNKLPRDLELDERTLQGCFARAFEMTDIRDPSRMDQGRLRTFATQWFEAIDNYTLEIPLVEYDLMVARNQPAPKTTPKTDTKGPGGFPPGGVPPGGMNPGIVPPNGQPPGGFPGKQ